MGLIILCFIVPLIIAIVLAIKDRDGEFIFFGIVAGLLFGLIGTLIAFIGGIFVETDKIYDNEKETPRIVTEYKTNSNPFATFFLLPFSESTSVYVPEGTIKYNYNIDLE